MSELLEKNPHAQEDSPLSSVSPAVTGTTKNTY